VVTVTDKDKKVIQCKSKMCCKATASLESSVEEDLEKEDKCLGSLLDGDDNSSTSGGGDSSVPEHNE
jgi:hypothetical protein